MASMSDHILSTIESVLHGGVVDIRTRRIAMAIKRALRSAGYAVVPVEPTEAMEEAGRECERNAPVKVWHAMVSSATQSGSQR